MVAGMTHQAARREPRARSTGAASRLTAQYHEPIAT